MSPHFHKARLLVEHRRYPEAVESLQAAIAENPEFAPAYALMAFCHSNLGNHSAALHAAQTAIRLEPDNDYHLYTLGIVQHGQKNYDEATRAVQAAIRMEPTEPSYYALLSSIYVDTEAWQNALQAANEGLRLDPENVRCANLRAVALVKLGRRVDAEQTIDIALSQQPDNPMTHANKGWTSLHQNNPKEAMHHFGEALRLDPNMRWAQAGIVEAMKARNPIYRVMLAYFLWMERLDGQTRWLIIIGAYFLFRFLGNFGRSNPEWQPFVLPVLYVYLAFVFLTWTASTLFDLLLRLDKFGRLALSRKRLIVSNWVGIALLTALGFLLTGLTSTTGRKEAWFTAALQTAVFIIPLATTLRLHHSKLLIGSTIILGGIILYNLVSGLGWAGTGTGVLYWYGIFIFSWVANAVATQRRR